MTNLEQQISALEQKIQSIDAEREALFQELTKLKRQQQSLSQLVSEATITQYSPSSDKISLFRSLFKGRDDVYPKRWKNSKTGISGYSFSCANSLMPVKKTMFHTASKYRAPAKARIFGCFLAFPY